MRYEIIPDTDSLENPLEDNEWTMVSFGRRHHNYTDPSAVGIKGLNQYGEVIATQRLQRKLDSRTAFILGYYEHGRSSWFLKGEGGPGTDCQWDGVPVAGLLRWDGKARDLGKTIEDREKYARGALETYTQWCNGDVWGYKVFDDDDEEVDSCWGFFGYEYAEQEAKSAMEYFEKEMACITK